MVWKFISISNARPSRGLSARFARSRDGVAAVEFAIVAGPFLALLFAIIEVSLGFWNQQVLETAVSNVSRQLYTGSFQNESGNATKTKAELATEFKSRVCAEVRGMFNCASMVTVDIRPGTDFATSSAALPITTNPVTGQKTYDTTGWGYEPAQQNSVVVVRAAMQYPAFVNLLGAGHAQLSNGNRLVMATAAFRTEPFGTAPTPSN